MSKTTDILSYLEDSLLNLAKAYEGFSREDNLEHEKIKDFDKEIGDLIDRTRQLKDIHNTVSDEELTALQVELKALIDDIGTKLENGFFKGLKGEPFKYEDFTPQQIEDLKIKGDSFKFSDFTNEQIESLKVKGDSFKFTDFTPQQIENLKIKGDEGKPFTYDMFTAQQLESLKGVSIKDIKTTNNELVIVDSENKEYNLGNFTNDYNNLVNRIDYEDGTWSPALSDDSILSSYTNGHYARIGNIINFSFFLKIDEFNTFDPIRICNLPFAPNLGPFGRTAISVYFTSSNLDSYSSIIGLLGESVSSNFIELFKVGDKGSKPLTRNDFSINTSFYISGSYLLK